MTTESPTTASAVRALLENRRSMSQWTDELEVLGCSALRLAELVHQGENASSCANAARELRQQLDLIRSSVPAANSIIDELIAARSDRLEAAQAATDDASEDPPDEGALHAW